MASGAPADHGKRPSAARLLERAAAARAGGDLEGTRAALLAASDAARAAGDSSSMAEAALELSRVLRFGPHAGQVPVLLREAYVAVDEPATRCRLAAALARVWVYGSDAARA